ncbi:hypothetical protein M409DRAFT_54954 [Zasmidium cellare ATCC 36951]|uniref:Transcription factor domain-containing protein n=1 Tax=Zasmidium cellare ATCC 36951 TaxID=1080233 RepID=A0A6A6CMF7_ZASCE|nr:uncharacterized protein M409DRAFT_54954 [Zasmidium cellare ATCC 36951]KAF2166626.1 hypothetical protein M409DRAFT_54954 [Zasmidium cellare ATCC 36951]
MTEKRGRVVTSKPTRQGCRTCRQSTLYSLPACLSADSFLGYVVSNATRLDLDVIDVRRAVDFVQGTYPPTGSPRSSFTARQLLPLEAQGPSLCSMPSLTLDTTDYERYAFDYFRRTTARQMHLNTPRAWMTRLVLRLSHEIPVFRAIAALGGIHRGLVQITHVGFVHTFLEDRNTLHQYGKAIVALEPHIGELYSRFTPVLETVLCACILLAACEIVKSDTTAAISHLRFGNRVFLDYDPTKQTGMLYETETSKTLISTFKLLQANGILLETRSAESCSSIPSSPMSSPPPSDLETLRVTLERLTTEERDLRTDLLRMAQADASQDLTGKNILEKCLL